MEAGSPYLVIISLRRALVSSREFFLLSFLFSVFFFSLLFFFSPGLHPYHMEVARLGVKLELQLLAYTTATATPVLSRICDLYHSSRQRRFPNPLSESKDQTCILMDTSRIHFPYAVTGTPCLVLFLSSWGMPQFFVKKCEQILIGILCNQ